MFHDIITIFNKEFNGYFRSRLGYSLLIIYFAMVLLATFFGTDFLKQTSSGLVQFFSMQKEVLLLLIPALTMKLWTDEQRQNTLELLLSQPVSLAAMVVGKFLAAWIFSGLLLVSTSGLWILSAWDVSLDNMAILLNFCACFLMSGALCAICAAVSALTSHAISSFIISLLVTFTLGNINFEYLLQKAKISNEILSRSAQVLNFEQHFGNIIAGQLSLANVFYYVSFIGLALWFNIVAVEYKRN